MRLFGFGQTIDSNRPIDGALHDAVALPSITIRHAAPAPVAQAELYARCDDGVIFTAMPVGVFRCRVDGVEVVPRPDADPADVAALLIATALPAVLWMQGHYLLHASAVRVPGRVAAVAFAGPRGIGKSTVAAAALARGADLVADDSMVLSTTGVARGLPGGVFVTAADGARRFMPVAAGRALASAPLAAVFVLERGDGAPRLLSRLQATEALLRHRHRARIPTLLGAERDMLTTSALLSGAFPVYTWPRRAGATTLDDGEWQMLHDAARGKSNV